MVAQVGPPVLVSGGIDALRVKGDYVFSPTEVDQPAAPVFEHRTKKPVKALAKYIKKNQRLSAQERKRWRKKEVLLGFVISTQGKVLNLKVVKGLSDACNNEAIRLLKGIPRWQPAKFRGYIVNSQYYLKVKFK
jgi:protein TonB